VGAGVGSTATGVAFEAMPQLVLSIGLQNGRHVRSLFIFLSNHTPHDVHCCKVVSMSLSSTQDYEHTMK